MKKRFAFAIVLTLALTLTACAALPVEISVKTTDPVITPTETTEHIVPKPTEVIAPQQEPTTENPTEPPATEPTEPPATEPAATEPTEPPVEKPTEGQIKKMKTKDEAKAIAFNHAKVKASQVRDLEIELDKERGVTHYDVSFEAGNTDYDYEIEAYTGEILRHEKETEKKPAATAETITKEKAKTIALNHAKVKAADVRDFEIELDKDDGTSHYDICFRAGNTEYEYEIDAASGKVLRHEKETEPAATKTAAQAKAIALKHAGVKQADARDLEVEADTERGKTVYEVSFSAGGYDYEYTIDGQTGEILHQEKERD